jgi:hypothetical protein
VPRKGQEKMGGLPKNAVRELRRASCGCVARLSIDRRAGLMLTRTPGEAKFGLLLRKLL